MKYSRTLDGLRGIAILLVLFFHYDFILGCGWVGVQLFFVLSGFLITSILLKDREAPLGFYLKRFYWRRTLRIFPLYYAYLLFVGVVFLVAHIPDDFTSLVPYLATYTFNFYPLVHLYSFQDYFFMHFWSLSVEEQFYLIWPLVIFFCHRRQLKWVLIAFVAAAPLTRYLLGEWLLAGGYDPRYTGETVYRFTLSQWDGFAFGAIIPVFSLTSDKFPAKKLLAITAAILLALGAWNFLALQKDGDFIDVSTLGYEIGNLINYQHIWSYTLLDFFFCLVIVCILNPEGWLKKFTDFTLGNSVMVYFGKISYGLYVYHFIIWMTFNKYLKARIPGVFPGFILYVLVCLLTATISYYIFERRILLLKDRFFTSAKPVVTNENRTSV